MSTDNFGYASEGTDPIDPKKAPTGQSHDTDLDGIRRKAASQAAAAPGFFANLWSLASVEPPSWARGIITAAVVIAVGVGVAWTGPALAAAFVAGAMTLTMSSFLLWMAWFIAWCVAIYFGANLMVKVAQYFLTKHVDNDIARIRNSVSWALTADAKPVMRAA